MQPLDHVNSQFRRRATAMRTAAQQQRFENDEQRARMRALRDENRELRRRTRLDETSVPE
jgi:hypothetical protein